MKSGALTVTPQSGLRGEITLPGDKSISHRALILGAMASGVTRIRNLGRGADNLSTMNALRSLGVDVSDPGAGVANSGTVTVKSGGLSEPADVVDAGNSGTTLRLLTGALAASDFLSVITGDSSLRERPVKRVIEPLRLMGADIRARKSDTLPPVVIRGKELKGIRYEMPVASAQVKSAILLAGLKACGKTTVVEKVATRDHTELMIKWFGGDLSVEGDSIELSPSVLSGRDLSIPGDVSSAAFLIVAAVMTRGSEILIRNVALNERRTGFLDVLAGMGARIEVVRKSDEWEPSGDIRAFSSELSPANISGGLAARCIDELPVLAVAMAAAGGESVIADAAELRVKETDRIKAMAGGLKAMGMEVDERPDGLAINGGRLKGGRVESFGDHRIAMAFAVAGLAAEGTTEIVNFDSVEISFPDFLETLRKVGVNI